MGLIDVDKLLDDVEYWENHDDPKKPGYDTRDIEQVIGFQPIVEAIPVEWLNEYAHKLIKLEQSQPVAYRWFSVLGENILQMIHDWRKEMGVFDDLLPNCVKHARVMKEIENQLEERNGK